MDELVINYSGSKGKKFLLIIAGGYFVLYGIYVCVLHALAKNFGVDFYLPLVGVVLGTILVLSVTLWASKPIFRMDTESIYVNMPGVNTVYQVDWLDVKEVAIGLSYLKFSETDGKTYTLEIGGLKYDDLKKVKSRVIELCESKNVPYRND